MPFMIEDLNICCLWYLKSTVSTLYLILEKYRFFIPGFQVIDFEFLQAKGLCVFFLNRLLINFAWSTQVFPRHFSNTCNRYSSATKLFRLLHASTTSVAFTEIFYYHWAYTGCNMDNQHCQHSCHFIHFSVTPITPESKRNSWAFCTDC